MNTMIMKIISIIGLILILGGGLLSWRAYGHYKQRQVERVARLQEKAEEITVTTIEGWTVADIAAQLEKQGFGSAKDFIKTAQVFDTTSFPLTGRPAKTDLEGYLFPDTYRFAKTASSESILDKMLQNFTARVQTLGVTQAGNALTIPGYDTAKIFGGDGKSGMSLYDIITLASIIEQESGGKGAVSDSSLSLNEERKLVASVFYNRMQIGQALESDATINYVTGKNSPAASIADLEVNSPYNTYKYAGLPPGPICNPSLGSIAAALNPAHSDYFYFLHKQPSGKVEFSKTFEEHKRKKLE